MTESEWQSCTDPKAIIGFLGRWASNRKLWLFACGACRGHVDLMSDARCRAVVEVGERYADGHAGTKELREASEEAFCRRDDLEGDRLAEARAIVAAFAVVDPDERDSALPAFKTASKVEQTSDDLIHLAELGLPSERGGDEAASDRQRAAERERAAQCHVLRDIFGNPFRPASIDPAWLSSNVVALARTIYEERAFDRMPELADALEAAGCHAVDILDHCRQAEPHVRGCWVVDAILGKL